MLRLLLCILWLGIAGCAETPKPPGATDKTIPETELPPGPSPGRLLTMQAIPSAPDIHYAAYFPATYSENRKFPVLLLFDPHGDPVLPLRKYQALADEMGYILMGSHESKNGLGARQTADIFMALATQARALPKADTNLIYAGGFSGGGRVAAMMGLAPLRIRGILTCGAGVSSGAWFGVPPYVIVSIAGTRDMNMNEVKSFTTQKKDLLTRYFKIYFEGGHNWPPREEMKMAMLTFQRLAITDGLSERNAAMIQAGNQWQDDYVAKIRQPVIKAETYYNMLRNSEGLMDISALEKKYRELKNSTDYKQAAAIEKKLEEEEDNLRINLQNAIFSKDTLWWQATGKSMFDTVAFAANKPRIAMVSRVQGFLSLLIYSTLTRSIQAMHQEQNSYLSTLYRVIDPSNSEAWYLSAVVAAQQQQPDRAAGFLAQAVTCGFNDSERCRKETYFAGMQQDIRFQEVLAKMIR